MSARLAAVALGVSLVLAGCGEDEPPVVAATPTATASPTPAPTEVATAGPSGKTGKDCAKAEDFSGEPKVAPADDVVEAPAYFRFYRSERGPGKAMRFYAVLDGDPAALATRRDDALNFLVQNAGYAPVSNAFKGGVRASAKLESPEHELDLVVTPLCEGKLRQVTV